MKTLRRLALLVVFSLSLRADDTALLFTYFTKNGEDGLHLATSTDGLHWTSLHGGASLLTPMVGNSKLMRDPCLLLGPDGVFRMVWTDSWDGQTIGYASSKDLITWSEQKALPVMKHEPTTVNCWAPEIVYDAQKKEYVIFWASTVPGRFMTPDETGGDSKPDKPRNHRIYATTTKDFESFTPTKLFYEPGFNCIDATLARDGDEWLMVVKNEVRVPEPAKFLYTTHAKTLAGPWSPPSERITGAYWAEGPTAIKVGEWWHVYFDKYRDKKYGLVRSKDLKSWEDISDQLQMPSGVIPRHGTALRVPAKIVEALK